MDERRCFTRAAILDAMRSLEEAVRAEAKEEADWLLAEKEAELRACIDRLQREVGLLEQVAISVSLSQLRSPSRNATTESF